MVQLTDLSRGWWSKEPQLHGIDYQEVFAPVARYGSLWLLLALSTVLGLHLHQMDVSTAFLNDILSESIYTKQSLGFRNESGLVCKLQKSLFGLKHPPLIWYEVINAFLKDLGFLRCKKEHILYLKRWEYGLEYNGNSTINVELYTDASFANANEERKSTTGYVSILAGACITWKSVKQDCISVNTVESELVAASEGVREAMWLRLLLDELGYGQVQRILRRMIVVNYAATIKYFIPQ
ncbi:unnamed protein product [Phytophthora fragariaefolia]|uniref:Unnamed protein product n=1 Tax=Phytophthora fragariaefolia TaxID=1490495 RepID=A0A9W6TQT1_9STRA|nr:unnamed protein product [Phytophthora fragariaefolia]